MNKKLIRITTVPISLDKLLGGQLRFMGSHYEVTAVASEKEYLERIGKKENTAVFHLEMTRKITPLADLKAVLKLYSFFKKTRPFIVHSHTPKAGIVGMLAARLAGVPHRLHTVAGLPLLEAEGFKRKLLDFVEKVTYGCATKVYPNSHGLLDIINQNQYCPADKLRVLASGSSNGIDTGHFDPSIYTRAHIQLLKKELGIKEQDFVFVFVGRLVKDKGINELVAAFSKLQKQQHCRLILAGPFEPELDPLETHTIEEINSNKNIIATGYQNDVRPYFAISDALVFPSYREGFPNVVLQAGAMGLPAIVSNINGCNEIITSEINGLIVPPKSEAALLEAMELLLANGDLRDKMTVNARPMIVSRYQQDVVWNAILEEYRELE
jgi:glycosyltransferase involved in cell wall biosynthesis